MKYKQILSRVLLVILFIFEGNNLYSADGDIFKARTSDGLEMTFKVLSEKDKTCQVGDGIYYYDDFTTFSKSYSGNVTIPATAKGYTVTTIGEYAFWYSPSIQTLTIPSSVTNITHRIQNGSIIGGIVVEDGNVVFDSRNNCNAIIETKTNKLIIGCSSTIIPNSIEIIGESAFYSCPEILTIPNSVKILEDKAFYRCDNLRKVILSNSVTSMGSLCFGYCSSLTEMNLPNSLQSIGELFAAEANLKEVIIPASVTSIGERAFIGCDNLSKIVVDTNNETYNSFDNCNAIIETKSKTLIIGCKNSSVPETVTAIGEMAFQGCAGLTSITLPNSLISIGNLAFRGCPSLKSITIPKNVSFIGDDAFSYSENLVEIKSLIEEPFSISKSVFQSIPATTLYVPYGSKQSYEQTSGWNVFKNIVECELKDGDVFTYRTAENVKMTFKVISMANKTCQVGEGMDKSNPFDCYREAIPYTTIGKITIPEKVYGLNVVNLAYCCFFDCPYITEIHIPNTVEKIETSAFDYCSSLTGLAIPKSVNHIGGNFSYCGNLKSIVVDSDNKIFDSRDNCNAIINTAENELVIGCNNSTIPQSVKSIASWAFSGCESLEELIFPDNSVTSIGSDAFRECISLKSIRFPNSLISIGEFACWGCKSMKAIAIPYSVQKIGEHAFANCQNLSEIRVDSENGVFDSRDNCNAIIETATNSLKVGCYNTMIPQTITSIGDFAFQYCTGLSQIVLPNSITNIGQLAFYGCSKLASVTIPNVVTSIGESAFEECPSLLNIASLIENPFEISDDTFDWISEAKLYIPQHTRSLYNNMNGWKKFQTIIELEDGCVFTAKTVENIDMVFEVISGIEKTCQVGKNNTAVSLNTIGQVTIPNSIYGLRVVSIGDNAFMNCAGVNYVSIPESVKNIGNGIFDGCKSLAVIQSDANAIISSSSVSGLNNPNLLLYVNNISYAPTEIYNVVVNGIAENILLQDALEGNDFYCPLSFTARNIKYIHNYSMTSGYNSCRGWETLALPFDVTTTTNEKGIQVVPYYKEWNHKNGERPFWLYTLGENGWEMATSIKANVPYIICMPNHEMYDAEYNLNGNIIFIGTNVQVHNSNQMYINKYKQRCLIPNYQNQEAKSDIFALNVNNLWNQYTGVENEGSVFIRGLRQVRPFEAYMMLESNAAPQLMIPIFDDNCITGVKDISYVQGSKNLNGVYSLNGQLVRSTTAKDDLKQLPKGIYIANGRKVVIK